MESFEKYVGKPLSLVCDELEKEGKKVVIKKNSITKIQTDYELVVLVKPINDSEVEVVVGDFLINIENKIK